GPAIIPADRVIEWKPGVPGGIPDPSVVCPASAPSVQDFGAAGDGATDDASAFADAIAAASDGSAIRIPAGTYVLRSGITIDKGVVLCGEGPGVSRLEFDTDSLGIDIVTYDRGDWVSIESGYTKGSTTLAVVDGSSFGAGDYAELKQTNNWDVMDPEGEWENASWVPEDAVGQVFRVVSVSGDTLTVEPPAHMDYDANYDPVVRRMGLVEGAGLQSLSISRTSTGDAGTVQMKNAVACWMRDCISENTTTSHVDMSSALWCEVRDSIFNDAYDHGGGGHGYGTNLGGHVTASLVENNIFIHLRHSMLVQVGATGNVFGYNYSREPFQSEGGDWTPCDISLHGHYPNMNLFEANTVQEADVSDYWGPCGPGNTFFRNRLEAEGIEVMDHSHRQNVVGNELTTDPNIVSADDTVNDTWIHANYEDGSIHWDLENDVHEIPASLYLDSKPGFFEELDWPVTGADLAPDSGLLPAEQRYLDL
ncbi:MAG: dockerin, partial [Deltaproteobacteria bacterium]|nr:dockerin [Deltaproteobacteria bacterium]